MPLNDVILQLVTEVVSCKPVTKKMELGGRKVTVVRYLSTNQKPVLHLT